ncbi:unnamed protein product [Hydatigera taeniaeformis]|uniref:Uncharacterized protein n=1 Tax=Hydatigena taeniaeformis TaxID=6205 RepID=A0A0R3WSB0_HYDTA|nr:unnamed protein product [Hydatigera taeniaeformis]
MDHKVSLGERDRFIFEHLLHSSLFRPDTVSTVTTSAAAVDRRLRLGEHHSFDSTLSGSANVATVPSSTSHRRWSTSSPTNNVCLSDGITSFDGRLAPNAQVQHPIAIRANPVQMGGGTLTGAARAPTPPPRARAKTMPSDTVICPPVSLIYTMANTLKPHPFSHQLQVFFPTDFSLFLSL